MVTCNTYSFTWQSSSYSILALFGSRASVMVTARNLLHLGRTEPRERRQSRRRSSLSYGVMVIDMGVHELSGITNPINLVQVSTDNGVHSSMCRQPATRLLLMPGRYASSLPCCTCTYGRRVFSVPGGLLVVIQSQAYLAGLPSCEMLCSHHHG